MQNNLRAKRELCFVVPLDTFRLASSLETAKIWNRIKELYSWDDDLKDSIQTIILSEFGAFKQKSDETLDQVVNRFNHLLSKMLKHGLKREIIEHKLTFMNGLKSEWKSIVSTAHEQLRITF